MKYKYTSTILVLLSSLFCLQSAVANEEQGLGGGACGSLENHHGPFDYTDYNVYKEHGFLVESNHFDANVESLNKGVTTNVYGDLDYVLRVFPNHHRALTTLSKYEFQVENAIEKMGESISVECFFNRAIVFKPNDGIVRLIYATYLHRKGNFANAKLQYQKALEINPDSAEAHYNFGLYYVDTNHLNMAVKHGHRAYELGYPLPGLKNKLIRKGVWDKTVSHNTVN